MSASIWAPGSDIINIDAETTNKSQVFTATAGQTAFTLTSFTYTVGTESIAVYRGGQRLIKGVDWSETDSTTFTITGISLDAGETIECVAVLGASGANAVASAASAAAALVSETNAAVSEANAAASAASAAHPWSVESGGIYYDGGAVRLGAAGARILGDFSNATFANRVMFQTAGINTYTSVGAVPAGSGSGAYFVCYGGSDPDNASAGYVGVDQSAGHILFASTKMGTGTYLPMTFHTGGSERLRIDTSGRLVNASGSASDTGAANARLAMVAGNIGGPIASGTTDANVNYRFAHSSATLDNGVYVAGHVWWQARSLSSYATNYDINFQPNGGNTLHVGPNGGLGYGTGAGGTVTQATSKATAVTLNKPTGQITMNTASLAAGAVVTFAVNNSLVNQYDVPVLAIGSVGTGSAYEAWVSYVFNGYFYITLKNITAGALAEAVKINFAIIRGATA